MVVHFSKAYYALEAKAMATEELVPRSGPQAWVDLDCDCWTPEGPPPPPFFHLPPPPRPPSFLDDPKNILGPLNSNDHDDCQGPWTCPALLEASGGKFGGYGDEALGENTPDVPPVAVIIVSASVLGFFVLVATIIVLSRLWRTYKSSSKKNTCDPADMYEDMPVEPPLLAPPHQCPPPLHHYKDQIIPLPRPLPSAPAVHLYSPEPRPNTPSDHLYHHISSGSETCSCSTGEAACNTLLPSSLRLIHSEDEEHSLQSSSHSYHSGSSTATPASSSPVPMACAGCPSVYQVSGSTATPSSGALMLPATYGSCGAASAPYSSNGSSGKLRYGHGIVTMAQQPPCGQLLGLHHPSSRNVRSDIRTMPDNMVPLAQIYSPGSHLYESATLLRPGHVGVVPKYNMIHWGNIPAPFVQAVNSQEAMRPPNAQFNCLSGERFVPMHCTTSHPLQYGTSKGMGDHQCGAIEPLVDNMRPRHHFHTQHKHHLRVHPGQVNDRLQCSTLVPNVALSKSLHDVTRNPDDISLSNSIRNDILYNISPPRDLDLVATTCLTTIPANGLLNQSEYSYAIDAVNLNQSSPTNNRLSCNTDDSAQATAMSDTSSSSHRSCEVVAVTESSSLDSSGTTTSSTTPLSGGCTLGAPQRKELPPLPSRADRYRIYAQNSESGRFNSYRKSPSVNSNVSSNNNNTLVTSPSSGVTDSTVRLCDTGDNDLYDTVALNTAYNSSMRQFHVSNGHNVLDDGNVVNNNLPFGTMPGSAITSSSSSYSGKKNRGKEPANGSRNIGRRELLSSEVAAGMLPTSATRREISSVDALMHEAQDEEDALYDSCSDT